MPAWITREVMSQILRAVEARDKSVYVFYITAGGGMGKTVLLRQVGMHLGSQDGIAPALGWSGIVDLYHSDANTNSGLEWRLSKSLERAGEFQAYWNEREAYKARREAGETGKELEDERLELAEVFAGCVNNVTARNRMVIALDTTERIQYETDIIQKECHLERETATIRAWLMDQLKKWKNCVVLLAGRPDSELQKALAQELAGTHIRYLHLELRGFTESEASDYFAQQEDQYPVVRELFSRDLRHRLWQVTGGKPIRLDLAVYVAQYELGLDRLDQKIRGASPEQTQEWIDRLLIEHIMQQEPDVSIRTVLRCLTVARKGLDAMLLHQLAGEWTLEECQQHLDAIAGRAFIKERPEEKRLFLHDEMYKLCDTFLLTAPEVQEMSARLVKWYDAQIKNSRYDSDDWQNYQVDSILYRLRTDPRQGYHHYAMLVDEAIRYAEVGFDMRMRNELLAFLGSESPIDQLLLRNAAGLSKEVDCDCAGRWVKRYLVRDEYAESIQVAETVKKDVVRFYPSDVPGSRLSLADLDVYYSQALIYSGGYDKAITLLQGVISELEGEHGPDELARQGDPHSFEGWRRNLVLGRAHNNLGYTYSRYQNHCKRGLREFRAAVPYFRASDLKEEYANTLDNMGRVNTSLAERARAESLMDDSLALRRELGRDYRVALSLNSRAIAHLVFNEPHRAKQLGEETLSIFERLGAQRGIALASITLGWALRMLGALGLYPHDESDRFFREAIVLLERAVNISETKFRDPVYLISAYDELGCTYRDRAALARATNPRSPLAQSLFKEAVNYMQTSTRSAENEHPVRYVDACEDLAQTFFKRQEYHYAQVWLQNAEIKIPDDYKLKPGVSPTPIDPDEQVEEYWQMLGKIELLRGYLAYNTGLSEEGKVSRQVLEQSLEHFVLAYAYFERYSPRSARLETTVKELYGHFKKCKHDDLHYMQDELLPHIAETYSLDQTQLALFFEDTLGLALQLEE